LGVGWGGGVVLGWGCGGVGGWGWGGGGVGLKRLVYLEEL